VKTIATVVTAGALALVAGSLVMLEASDQAAADFRGGGVHVVGGGRTMSGSVARPATPTVSASPISTTKQFNFGRGTSTKTSGYVSSTKSQVVATTTTSELTNGARKPRIGMGISNTPPGRGSNGVVDVGGALKPGLGKPNTDQRLGAGAAGLGTRGDTPDNPGLKRGSPPYQPRLPAQPPGKRDIDQKLGAGAAGLVGPGGIRQGPGNTPTTPKPFLATPDTLNVPAGGPSAGFKQKFEPNEKAIAKEITGSAPTPSAGFKQKFEPNEKAIAKEITGSAPPPQLGPNSPHFGVTCTAKGCTPNPGPNSGTGSAGQGGMPKLPTTVAGPPTPVAGTGVGQPPPGNVNITVINNRYVNVFGGPRRIWWAGSWASLAAPAVIPGVWDGGIQYEPRGYVALAKPVCSGVTPEGYRLTWRDVPTDTGVVIPQCVAYYPRGRAAPAVAVGAVPGQAVRVATPVASAMAQGCRVEIYSQVAFTGTSSDVAADQPRLSEYGWDKQISSLNVKSGTWDFYSEPDYGGPTMRLPPGQYANLEGWDKQISSFMCTQPQ
jgi:hypothetical protein